MKLVTVEHQGRRFAGALEDDYVVPLGDATEFGPENLGRPLAELAKRPEARCRSDEVRFLAPVPNPGKIICVGLNYLAHVHETGRDLPEYPVLFSKFAASLTGPFDPILAPWESEQVDYEGELAVVIGAPARRVAARDAMDFVAGFAVANDVTVRDYQYKTHQWLQGKAWDRSTPIGPALVTPDEVGDPAKLHLSLTLNGSVMQSADTSNLMFDVPKLISVISEFTTLGPGDIVLTGTPGGVGYRRDPQVFLSDGDVVSVEIPGVGRIENTVLREPHL